MRDELADRRLRRDSITDASALERVAYDTMRSALCELAFRALADTDWAPAPRIEDLQVAARNVADALVDPLLSPGSPWLPGQRP